MAKASIADQMLGLAESQLDDKAERVVRSYNSVKYVFKDGSYIVVKDGKQVRGGERA